MMANIKIHDLKVHYPELASDIKEVCEEIYHKTKPYSAHVFMFNEVLVIMAHKEDVSEINILGEKFGILKKE